MKKIIQLTLIVSGISFSTYAQQGMGVGNNNPQEMLDVTGAIKIGTDLTNTTGAPTGGAGTVRFRAGIFEGWDGSQWVALGSGGADTDWTISGNNQYSAVSGNVGIGTTSPSFRFEVVDDANAVKGMKIRNSNGGSGAYTTLRLYNNVNSNLRTLEIDYSSSNYGTALVGAGPLGESGSITTTGTFPLTLGTSNTARLTILGGGNVGIGTISPTAKLEVNGQVKISGGAPGANKVLTSDAAGLASWVDPATLISNDGDWTVSGNNQYSAVSGNVGIGTTAPNSKLHLSGTGHVGAFINAGTGFNSYVDFAENGVWRSNIFWNGAGDYLEINSSTSNSVLNPVGGNVGIGETNPIFKLDVGHPGANSQMRVRGNWVSNLANNARTNFIDWNFGIGAGRAGAAGDATVMWSFNGAGRGILFASTSNGYNQHFGQMQHNMYIQGSDGNVGIGITSPTAKLEVAGQVKITGGTPGANKVLTSDAAGLASWVDPATLVSGDNLGDHVATENIQLADFYLSNDGDDEGIIIDDNGNVGIGTTTPVNQLHIQSNINGLNFPVFLRNSSINSGDGVGIGFLSEPNGNWTKAGIYYERTGGFGTGKLHFLVDDAADNGTVTLSESRLTIKPDGDVGIGTTNPSRNLDVYEDVNGTVSIRIENPNTGANSVERLSFDNEDGGVAAIALYDNDNGAYPNQMRMFNNRPNGEIDLDNGNGNIRLDENGNVGIGTDNPTLAKLQLIGGIRSYDVGLGNSDSFNGVRGYANFSSDNHATVVVGQNLYSNGGVLRIANAHSTLSGSGLIIPGNGQPGQGNLYFFATPTGPVTSNATIGGVGAAEMVLTTSGRLGVGTTSPIAPLHVQNTSNATYGNFTFYALNQYTNTPNNPTSCCGGLVNGVSIHAVGRVMASEFDAFSDARIKNVIGVSNTEEDLQKLLGIEITDYRMKDKAKDIKPYKKVIAQQVEKVYPEAVSTITDVVPDIYTLASVENGFVTVESDVELGDKVRLIRESGNEMVTVTRVDDNGFMTDSEITEEVFVYGREVDDFRAVDYEAISMLNVSATQQLFKMISELQADNKELEKQLSEYSSLKSDIELMKEALGIDMQTAK